MGHHCFLAHYKVTDGLCHRSRPSNHWFPYAPEKARHGILEMRRDVPSAGNLGQRGTLVEVSEKFCWPRLGSVSTSPGSGGCSSGHLIDASSRLFEPSPCAATWAFTPGSLGQRNFLRIMNLSRPLSVNTGSHSPQRHHAARGTSGLVERTNHTLGDIPAAFVSTSHEDWD